MHDRPLRSGQVTITPIGGHGIGHGHWVYDRVMRSRSCHYWPSQAPSSNYDCPESDVVPAARLFLALIEDLLLNTISGIENVEITRR